MLVQGLCTQCTESNTWTWSSPTHAQDFCKINFWLLWRGAWYLPAKDSFLRDSGERPSPCLSFRRWSKYSGGRVQSDRPTCVDSTEPVEALIAMYTWNTRRMEEQDVTRHQKEKSLNRQRRSSNMKANKNPSTGNIVSQLSLYLPQKKKTKKPFLQIHMLLIALSSFLLKHTIKMTSSGVRLRNSTPKLVCHQS